jgi:hypothetical protein
MAKVTLTYGDLPTRQQFDQLWDEAGLEATGFRFTNDPIVGDETMTRSELWEKIEWVWNEYADKLGGMGLGDDPEKQGSWLADVLSCLGVEWV